MYLFKLSWTVLSQHQLTESARYACTHDERFQRLSCPQSQFAEVDVERGALTRGEMDAAVPVIIRSTRQCYTARQEDIDNRSVSRRHDDMRQRGLASPDGGDVLALTFAYPVAKRDWAEQRHLKRFIN